MQNTPAPFSVEGLWVNFGTTAMAVAIALGLFIYIGGYFAGGKINKAKINACIFFIVVLNIFAMPLALKAYKMMSNLLTPMLGFMVVTTLWVAFLTGMAIHMYEIFIVTAKEAHPPES